MSKTPLSLTEVRGTLRQLVTWADAISRLKEILDDGAAVETRLDEGQRQVAEATAQHDAAVKRHQQDIDRLTQERNDLARAVETDRAACAARKAQLDTETATAQAAYDATKQSLLAQHTQLITTLKSEHARLTQAVAQARTAQHTEMETLQQERAALQRELQTLADERRRILQQFAHA